jgi:hypothetical protein
VHVAANGDASPATGTLLHVLARASTARQASGRGLVLMPAAALLVHQLRYWLAYGPRAGTELADQGHAYLGSLVPWIVMIAAGAFGSLLVRLARARAAAWGERRSFTRLWAGAGVGLLLFYAFQETLEGVLTTGHPGGFAGVVGHGGWWSVPAAAAVGLAVAALVRVGATLVRLAGQRRRPWRVRRGAAVAVPEPACEPRRRRPLAGAAAGRAPPRRRFAA